MEQSEAINELAAALAKAQGAMSNVVADKKATIQMKAGGQFSYNYADLAGVLETIRKPLSENSLCVVQGIEIEAGSAMITTQLIHASGQWLRTHLAMPLPNGATPQEIGSATAYGRRYSLNALIGLAAEDDDGKSASADQQKQTPRPQPPKPTREIEPAKAETHSEEQQDHTTPLNIEEMRQLASLVNKRWAGLPKKERAEAYAEWVGGKFGRHEGTMTPEERAIVIEALEFEIAEIESSEEPIDHE